MHLFYHPPNHVSDVERSVEEDSPPSPHTISVGDLTTETHVDGGGGGHQHYHLCHLWCVGGVWRVYMYKTG